MSLLIVQDSYGEWYVLDEPSLNEMRSEQYPDEYQVHGSVDGSTTWGTLIEWYGMRASKQIIRKYMGME